MSDKCMECDAVLESKYWGTQGWDWFHGYLPETVHFCPQHATSLLHNELREKSRIRPVDPEGSYATMKMSRELYDLLKLRLEGIGLAIGEMSPGDEPTKGQLVRWLEIACTLLDVSVTGLRKWIDSGARDVKG
jgi:hypothetical protein